MDCPDARMQRLIATIRDAASTSGTYHVEETHGAVVLLAGDRAFKIKKPVGFAYMDFSTLGKRRRAVDREVSVNRRTAPDLYLGVGAVFETGDRWRFAARIEDREPGEKLVEPVVVMRRFDGSRLLDRIVAADGRLAPTLCDELAGVIAGFHAKARRRRAIHGSRRVRDVLAINATGLRAAVPDIFDRAAVEDLIAASHRRASALGEVLDRRSRTGRVRLCHGDLHLRNIVLGAPGAGGKERPLLFDAIEFDESLATTDVGYDLAFLLMDLLHRDLAEEAARIWNGWLSATGDIGAAEPIDLFLSMRAAVRAHVSAALARQHPEDTGPAQEADEYLRLARDLLRPRPAMIVAIGGVSGTGKSTLARALAHHVGRAPGAVILRSDVIRKRLWDAADTERLPDAAYTPAVSARVFAEINRRAALVARCGHATIADAVFGHPVQRRRIAAVAARQRVPFLGVWLTLPVAEAEARVAGRSGDVSDATPAVVRAQAEGIAPPDSWLWLDARQDVDALVAQCLNAIG